MILADCACDLGDLGIFDGVAVLGTDIGVGTKVLWHSFVVESGHS